MRSGSASHGGLNTAGPELRHLAAVAFIDIVGYSALMAEDETRTHRGWMRLLSEVIRPQTAQHRGRVVKSTGDGVLVEFQSALDAVEWGREVQRLVRRQNESGAEPQLSLRIAVHVGDLISTEDDIYGDTVNIAARLQEHADPGGIVFSEAVHDLVRGTIGGQARDLGFLTLKNLGRPVRAYAFPSEAKVWFPAHPWQVNLPSIAVLPLRNLSPEPNDRYFAEGIVEDIIVSLSGLRELLVISRNSALVYGRRHADPREIGRALGVRYVMTGSARRSVSSLRISVHLVDGLTGAALWSDTSDVPVGELFDVQDHIVRRIVAGIAPHVRTAELHRAMRKRPDSFTAYDHTLRALDLMSSLDEVTFPQALAMLNKAMREDPGFAMPVAWAARWYSLSIGQGWSEKPREDAETAAALAARAIELDRQNALALATHGHLKSYLFHDYDTGLVYLDRALDACPNSSLAWILSSGTLSYIGRGEQAVKHAENGLRLSPFDQSLFYYYVFLSLAHYASGAFDEAIKWGRMSASEKPIYTANLRIMAASLAALDRLEEAREIAQRLMQLEPGFTIARYERSLLPFRDEAMRSAFAEQLRRAGLP
jgi:adenylate cyclase